MNENWKDIFGYEGLYQVSDLGNVRNRNTLKILKPRINNNGYGRVILRKDMQPKEFLVHRLVALNFIPQVVGKDFVNHIDENKLNNRVENLEWVTHKENMNHGTVRERIRSHKIISKKIIQYSLYGEIIDEFNSFDDAVERTGYGRSRLYESVNNLSKCNTKYFFAYEGETPNFKNEDCLLAEIEKERIKLGMAKSEFLKTLNITQSNYYIWEKNKVIPTKYLKVISQFLNISIDEAWELNC